MSNSIGEVKRLATDSPPDYAISRAHHHLEGMAFCLFGKQNKVTLLDPAQVENAIVTRRLRFFFAVIDGKGRQVSRRIGQEERYPASVHPPVHPPLTAEQVRAMLAARDLPEGPVVKQLLEWIAELENRQSEKK